MAEIQPPSFMTGCYTPQQFRLLWGSVLCDEGVADRAGGDLLVTPSEPGLSVDVAAGQAWIYGDTVADQSIYGVYSNSVKHLVLATANPTDPRVDLIVATVRDATYSGTDNDWVIQVVQGVASPAPTPPVAPSSSIVLAQIAVPAGATSLTAGNITDTRTQAKLCSAMIPVPTQTEWLISVLGTTFVTADQNTWHNNDFLSANLPAGRYWTDMVLITESNIRQDMVTDFRGVTNWEGYQWIGSRYNEDQNYGDGIINYAKGTTYNQPLIPGTEGLFHSTGAWDGDPPLRFNGVFIMNAPATFGPRHRKAVTNGSQIIVKPGSWLHVKKLS